MNLDDDRPGTKPSDGSAQATDTFEAHLAERVRELLPDLNAGERLELPGAMDPADMSTSLGWIATAYPQVFDFAIVRDRALTGRLTGLDVQTVAADTGWVGNANAGMAGAEGGTEPYCAACGEWIGMFHGLEGWRHELELAPPRRVPLLGGQPVSKLSL